MQLFITLVHHVTGAVLWLAGLKFSQMDAVGMC